MFGPAGRTLIDSSSLEINLFHKYIIKLKTLAIKMLLCVNSFFMTFYTHVYFTLIAVNRFIQKNPVQALFTKRLVNTLRHLYTESGMK